MKGSRISAGVRAVRRRGVMLGAVVAGLIGVMAFAAVPAVAGEGQGGDGPAKSQGNEGHHRRNLPTISTVNFRTGAIFSCINGADNTGIATNNTATISASLTTVQAVVTVHAPPGTNVSGQLDQQNCAKLKFFNFTVGASGVGTTTVTDTRITNGAFVWFTSTAGQFQITPIVTL